MKRKKEDREIALSSPSPWHLPFPHLHGLLRKGRVAGSEEFHISGKPESVEVPAQDEGHRRRIALGR